MHFLNPGLLGSRKRFLATFEGADSAPARARLARAMRPLILRRTKADVAPELPEKVEQVLWTPMAKAQAAYYEELRAGYQRAFETRAHDLSGDRIHVLEALLRLRQAACHPALLRGQVARTSSKLERLVEALEVAALEGHKALVFSQWTSLLDLIEPRLQASNLSFVRLDGSTRDRGEVVARFQADEGPPVLLISLKAGGVGLNLTAADHVFLCDPWWNPAVEAQAADRAHRIGQDKPVMVYRLVATDTVEERILALQEHKRALFDAALGDAGAAAGLTRDDLLALLS
jgi:SNF2 family DNA or RNA helicase